MYEFTYQRCTELPIWPNYDNATGLFVPKINDYNEFLVPFCKREYAAGFYPDEEGVYARASPPLLVAP